MQLALYRKYRPQKFNQVLGQAHITDALSNAIKLGNVSHAYLFSGTRGTGKTSVARIFATEIGTTANDLYEIDAASNRGIDDIRELREAVNTLPFESKYKVYIIDECLTEDHLVTMSDGSVKSIKDVKNGDMVMSVDTKTGGLIQKKVSNFFSRETKELIHIRTPKAKISCTPTHRLWVLRNGEFVLTQAKNISNTDFLFSPRTMPHVVKNTLSSDQLAFLALIQCDGHISKDSDTIQVEVSKDKGYFINFFKKGIKAWGKEGTFSMTTTSRGTVLLRYYSSQLKEELIKLKCFSGKKSSIVDIPDEVFKAPIESIVAYIDTCFCCEGDATHTKSTRLYKLSLSMVSEVFVKKLQLLMKKVGVSASIMEIERESDKHNTVFRLNLTGYDLRLFQERIGISMPRKARILRPQLKLKEKQDSIPVQISMLKKRKEINLTHSILNSHGVYLGRDQGTTRQTVETFINVAQTPEFDKYLQFSYDKILDIKQSKSVETVYDFTVDDTHTFLVDGVCTSNCHMLTKEAFNALLKTLEEPPAHAIFILATTESHKLPDTIISRCETHNFKKPSQDVLKDIAIKVAKDEGFKLDASGAELIAILGDGSFRDTLGTLQKVISGSKDKELTSKEVEKVTGAPSGELVNDILKAVEESHLEEGLESIGKATQKNVDIKIFLKLILHKARLVLLLRYAKDMHEDIKKDLSEKDFKFLKELGENSGVNSRALKILLDAYTETSTSYIPQLPLELALMKIIEGDK
jgi:DNA polymerase III subunit gamma/tau